MNSKPKTKTAPCTRQRGKQAVFLLRLFLLLPFLLLSSCRWDITQFLFRPPVDERVEESLSGALPAPPPASAHPDSFRFAVFGDPQVGADGRHLLGHFRADIASKAIDFFCVLGDLTDDATEEEFALIKAALDSTGIPYYTTLGNHDLYQKEGWKRYKDNFGPSCYSVIIANRLQLIFLDTAEGTIGATQFDWLEQELKNSRPYVTLVCTHFPCYDGITPGIWRLASAAERHKLQYLMNCYGVYAIASGHIHGWRHTQISGVHHFITGTMALNLDYGTNGYLLFTFARDSLYWERIEF